MVNERDGLDQPLELTRGLDGLVLESLEVRPVAATSCRRVRSLLEAGDVDGAMEVLRSTCPQLMQAGGTYHFKLVKQKFVELCGSGSDATAIACARDELAPLALDAYLEAYAEFKVCLQLLVYTKDVQRQQHEALRHICGMAGRTELAAAVYHAAFQALGLQEPTLVRLLTYLLRLHQVHRASLPDSQLQEQDLVDRLLLPGKDAAPLPCEGGLSSFREADIQALIHCAGCSRREAMDALKRTLGDVQQAFSQELARWRLDRAVLGQLLEEYVVFRGLEPPRTATGSKSDREAVSWVPLPCSEPAAAAAGTSAVGSWCEPMDTERVAHHNSDEQPRASGSGVTHGRAEARDAAGGSGGDAQQAPWSVRQQLLVLQPERSDTQSPPTKVARCEGSSSGCQTSPLGPVPCAEPLRSTSRARSDAQLQLPHLVNDLAKEGKVQEIIRVVTDLDAAFFDAHPHLFFELKRCEFLQLLDAGETTQALAFTRTQLAPLADQNQSFQPSLKATTAMLLGVGQRESAAAALQAAAAGLQAALRLHMGMRGPQLVRLLQVLLGVHRAWIRREKFNDPFQGTLKIDLLREAASGPAVATAAAPPPGALRVPSQALSLPDVPLASSDEEDGQAAVDEERILHVMEVLEIPRRTALDLLVHHDGDVEAAIMSSL